MVMPHRTATTTGVIVLGLIVGVASYPFVLYRDIRRNYDEVMGITAALNHYANPDVELPDNILDIFNWRP